MHISIARALLVCLVNKIVDYVPSMETRKGLILQPRGLQAEKKSFRTPYEKSLQENPAKNSAEIPTENSVEISA